MDKSPTEIALETLPGWEVVKGRERKKVTRSKRATLKTPDVANLHMLYLGRPAPGDDGFAPASQLDDETTEYIVMKPTAGESRERRVVVISHGRAVAIQG